MLSVLCVTKAEPHAFDFLYSLTQVAAMVRGQLVIGADGDEAHRSLVEAFTGDVGLALSEVGDVDVVPVRSSGYIESVHDQVLEHCCGDYVLRIDDDERCSPGMVEWLARGEYRQAPHWKFSRAHLWGDKDTVITNAPLWPDHQTRLSVKAQAGGRTGIHCGSPHGGGRLAPVYLEHHKFLVKSYAERQAIAARYDRVAAGAGTGVFLPFNLPEEAFVCPQLGPLAHFDAIAKEDARVFS